MSFRMLFRAVTAVSTVSVCVATVLTVVRTALIFACESPALAISLSMLNCVDPGTIGVGVRGVVRPGRLLGVAEGGLGTVDGHGERLSEGEIDAVRDAPGHHNAEPDTRGRVDARDQGDDAGRRKGRCVQGALHLVRGEDGDDLGVRVSGAEAVVGERSFAVDRGQRAARRHRRALRRRPRPARPRRVERRNGGRQYLRSLLPVRVVVEARLELTELGPVEPATCCLAAATIGSRFVPVDERLLAIAGFARI